LEKLRFTGLAFGALALREQRLDARADQRGYVFEESDIGAQ
jgi:hypothetical protein